MMRFWAGSFPSKQTTFISFYFAFTFTRLAFRFFFFNSFVLFIYFLLQIYFPISFSTIFHIELSHCATMCDKRRFYFQSVNQTLYHIHWMIKMMSAFLFARIENFRIVFVLVEATHVHQSHRVCILFCSFFLYTLRNNNLIDHKMTIIIINVHHT